jgi:RsiW-degrading membrane proteinase PrsW (M82 family)
MLALRNASLLLLELWLLSSATRTLTSRELLRFFLIGGGVMGMSVIFAKLFAFYVPNEIIGSIVVPIEEETLKILPVVFLLWRRREARLWALGATDVLLMATMVGAGFGLVEDANIFHRTGLAIGRVTHQHYAWLPTVVVGGGRHLHTIAGHAIWAGLAGGIMGIVLLRGGRLLLWPLAFSGYFWSALDHIGNNLMNHYRGPETQLLLNVTVNGTATVYLFVLTFCAAVAIDYYAVREFCCLPEARLPHTGTRLDAIRQLWAFLVDRRAVAYLIYRSKFAQGVKRARLLCWAAILDDRLIKRRLKEGSSLESPTRLYPLEQCFLSEV